jgi:RNA polymerase sigma-70 factor (ECF subfamily)
MSDGELVRQTLAGRNSAYEELVRRWAAHILAFCHAKVRSPQAAEDLAQETLVRGFRALASLAEPEKFGPWLRGIALRVCLNWLKSPSGKQVTFGVLAGDGNLDDAFPVHTPSPEQALARDEELARLMSEVESLPDDLREVLMLYYYQDVTYRDLAKLLDVSPATINARLTKARALLRERLARSRR